MLNFIVMAIIGLVLYVVISRILKNIGQSKVPVDRMTARSEALAKWKYSWDEWLEAAGSEYSHFIKNRDEPGELIITPTYVLVSNGSDEFYLDLDEPGTVITHCSFRKSASILKFRLRWKEGDDDGTEYHKEDILFPIPADAPEKTEHVVKYFNDKIDSNMEAVYSVVPNDRLTSLFWKDDF